MLRSNLETLIPEGTQLPRQLGAQAVHELPVAIRNDYLQAFGSAIHSVFIISAGVVVLGFVLALLMKNEPLRKG